MSARRTGGAVAPSAYVTLTCPRCKRKGDAMRETVTESHARRVLVYMPCGHYADLVDGVVTRSELES